MSKLIILRGVAGTGKSTLGKALGASGNGFVVMEMDDLKVEKYGTTTVCKPRVDFPEFGRRVRENLAAGADVVAIEAFVEQEAIEWFMAGTGRRLCDSDVYAVWLECDVDAAVRRKKTLGEAIVRQQHARLRTKFGIVGELCVNTSHTKTDEIMRAILEHIAMPR